MLDESTLFSLTLSDDFETKSTQLAGTVLLRMAGTNVNHQTPHETVGMHVQSMG